MIVDKTVVEKNYRELALVGGGMAAIVAGDLMPLFTSVQKMFSSVDSFTLAAIPFFMLANF